MFFNQKYPFVVRFKDGTFLKEGLFMGFVHYQGVNGEEGEFRYGRTDDLNQAMKFSMEWEIPKKVHELGVNEPYDVRQAAVQMVLIEEGVSYHHGIGQEGFVVYRKYDTYPEEAKQYLSDGETIKIYKPEYPSEIHNLFETVSMFETNLEVFYIPNEQNPQFIGVKQV